MMTFIKGDNMFIKYITAVYCWRFMKEMRLF